MLEECFTYQNAQKETHKILLLSHVGNYGNCDVKLGSQSQQKKFFEKMANGLFALNISGSLAVGARWKAAKKYIFSTEKPTIYLKSLGIYLKSCFYLDEGLLISLLHDDEDYRSTGYFMNF